MGVDHNGGSVLGGKIVLLQIGLEIELGGRLVLDSKAYLLYHSGFDSVGTDSETAEFLWQRPALV